MGKWEIHLDFGVVDPLKFTPGDWAQLREIKKDVIEMEKIKCEDTALLCAFIAYIHVRGIVEDTKRDLNEELH